IARFTRELNPLYLAIITCSILTAVSGLAVPFLIGRATDTVTGALSGDIAAPDALRTALWLAGALLLAELAATVISNVGGWCGDVMSNRMRTILSVRYYDKLLHLPQRWFDHEVTGTVVARLNRSMTEITNFAKSFANSFATMLITAGAVLVISAVYAWPLAVLLLVVFPVYVWLTALTSKKWQRLEGEKNQQIDIASGRFAEVVGQIRVVKSFVAEKRELSDFSRRFWSTDRTTRAQSTHWHGMDMARRAVLNLVFFGIYSIIFVQTLRGAFSLGEMVLLIQLMTMAREPVQSMSFVIDTAQHAIAGSKDYFGVMETEVDTRLLEDGQDPASITAVRDVHTACEADEDVRKDMDFAEVPGGKVALVGESGGGKSTIVHLLLGLYEAREGQVLVAANDSAELPLDVFRSRIGVVFQDASLFSGTIWENISYGRPEASAEEIRVAAERANAHRFIERFPAG